MKKNGTNKNSLVFTTVALVVLGIFALVIIGPIVWGIINSFKTEMNYAYYPVGFPSERMGGWQFNNYYIAYKILLVQIETADGNSRNVYALELIMNALIYASMATLVSVFSYAITSYCACKYSCSYTKFLYSLVIVVITLPIVGNLASEIQVAKAVGVYDSLLGISIMKGGFFGMYFLIFYASFKGVPDAYSEAAEIDGAGHWTIFFRIVLPMVLPTVCAVAFLSFIGYWNEYYTPMIYLPSHPTIAYGLFLFDGNPIKYNTIPVRLSASFLIAIPALILCVAFRKKLIGTMTMGGLKG